MTVVEVGAARAAIGHVWLQEYEAGLIQSKVFYFNIVHGDARDILILGWNTTEFSPAIRDVLPIGALDK